MSKPQVFRLPRQFDSSTLLKQAIPGEDIIIVKALDVFSNTPFQFSDTCGRVAIFRFEPQYKAHVLRVPSSIWNADKGAMAHAFMDQVGLRNRLIVTSETKAPLNAADISEWIQALGLLTTLAPEMQINTHDPIGMAQIIFETVSKSQVGQTVKSSGPYPEIEGSTPSPATTFKQPAEGTTYQIGNDSPETGATVTSDNAPNVVGQGDEPPVAPSSETLTGGFSAEQEARKALTAEIEAGIINDAWLAVEKPVRFKVLAGLLKVDEQTLKDCISLPLSTVELGHAGWVKRREPQA